MPYKLTCGKCKNYNHCNHVKHYFYDDGTCDDFKYNEK